MSCNLEPHQEKDWQAPNETSSLLWSGCRGFWKNSGYDQNQWGRPEKEEKECTRKKKKKKKKTKKKLNKKKDKKEKKEMKKKLKWN